MKVLWVRGNDQIKFNRPSTWFCLGLRGSGKSSFLEHVALGYMENNCVIADWFSSRDGENLAWLRSRHAEDKKILLLKGENVDVTSSYPVKQVDQLKLSDIEKFDILISSSPLYLNVDQEFYNVAKLTDLLFKRRHWKRLIFLVVREAANFYYSRLRVSENQLFAKANMVYLIREARHSGVALGLDSVRFYAIDIDIRNLSDYIILKSQGVQGLSRDLDWLYHFFNPAVVRSMKPQHFIMVSKTGALGLGTFPFHDWHKREKENILASVGVKVEYGEVLELPKDKGLYVSVGDREHSQIIEMYGGEGLSMNVIRVKLNRSGKTIHEHIHKHNDSVERTTFCPICKRVGSPFENKKAKRFKK